MGQRICTGCHEAKDESEFPPPKPSKNFAPRRRCRKCSNAVEAERVRRLGEAHAEYLRRYRAEHREYRRKWNLWTKYRITPEEYDTFLTAQGGVCAICKGPQDRVSRDGSMWFDVDHDHKTLVVRGLLCHSCNTGIGKLKDSPDLLEAAAMYLRRARAKDIGPAA